MGRPRLTTRDEAIATDYRGGQDIQQLMVTYGLSHSRVSQLISQTGVSRDTRSHPRGEQHPMCRYPDTLVAAVRRAKQPGVTYAAVAAQFGISVGYTWFLVNGKLRTV